MFFLLWLRKYLAFLSLDSSFIYDLILQIFQSGNPRAEEIVLNNMAAVLDRIFFEVEVGIGFA